MSRRGPASARANTQTANRALGYDQRLRQVYYKSGREFTVILLQADLRRGKGGWSDEAVVARKALDSARWTIVEANPSGDWVIERRGE